MILFRVDANEHIATGHMMRCITIANQLIKNKEEVLFCLAEDKFTDRLRDNEIPYIVLNSRWDNMESDISILEDIIEKKKPSWIIVDSYQATKNYLESLNKLAPVMYYDDMCKEQYNISAVLHPYDWGADEYVKSYKDKDVDLLVGLKYIPLREEFYPSKDYNKKNNILITTGGTDKYNISGKVIQKAMDCGMFENYRFNVIAGNMNENIENLKKLEEKYKKNVKVYYAVNNMGEMMRNSDCIVTAGGTTVYEICACRVPAVCFSFAENQAEFVCNLGKYNIMLTAGDARYDADYTVIKIVENIKKIVENFVVRKQLLNNMTSLVDTKGTSRLCKYLMN